MDGRFFKPYDHERYSNEYISGLIKELADIRLELAAMKVVLDAAERFSSIDPSWYLPGDPYIAERLTAIQDAVHKYQEKSHDTNKT
jgi:hypothetical protein